MPQTLPNSSAHISAAIRAFAPRSRFDAPAPLRLWHLTSLDAPTVAAVWTLAFAWAARIRLPVWVPILIALTAWAVYIADRLLDARTALRSGRIDGLQERHRFSYRHRRLLIPVAILAAGAAACIVFTLMPTQARERDSLLACAAFAYFTRVHAAALQPPTIGSPSPATNQGTLRIASFRLFTSRLFKKELLVGVLFTAACALPALTRASSPEFAMRMPLLSATLVFALLAWLNCYAIDRWEDSAGRTGVAARASLLALVAAVLAVFIAAQNQRVAALLAAGAASSFLLALLDQLRLRLTPLALRALADIVLLTPIILLAAALARP